MGNSKQDPLRLLDEVGDPLRGKEGTVFDKPAPTAPPQELKRKVPPHLENLIKFLSGIIADEGLLLDMCMDKAMGIVDFNFRKRAFGSDMMQEAPTPLHFIGPAAMLTVELYKQVLKSVTDQSAKYAEILAEAQKEMERGSRPTPKILTE